MAKETYYFSHDSNAITDTKIHNMRDDYALEEYALLWAIIEMMRNEESYKLQADKKIYRAIKALTNTNIDVEKYVQDCINEYELFKEENGYFFSNSLLKRMLEKDRKSAVAKEKAEKRWNNNAIAMQQQCSSNANKVKESIENKNKVNKKEQEEKIHFADFVTMTNVEHEKLVSTYGTEFTDQCIKILDNYKGAKGKDYKSDYRAILSWVVDEAKKRKQENKYAQNKTAYNDYSQRSYENLDSLYANMKEEK